MPYEQFHKSLTTEAVAGFIPIAQEWVKATEKLLAYGKDVLGKCINEPIEDDESYQTMQEMVNDMKREIRDCRRWLAAHNKEE